MGETWLALWTDIGPLVGVLVGGGITALVAGLQVRAQRKDRLEDQELERRRDVLAQARADILGILAAHETIRSRAMLARAEVIAASNDAETPEKVDRITFKWQHELHSLHAAMRHLQYSLEIAQVGDLHEAGLVVMGASANTPLRVTRTSKKDLNEWFVRAQAAREVLSVAASQLIGSDIKIAGSAVPSLKLVYEELVQEKLNEIEGRGGS